MKRIAVMTSGGDSPGMNSAIRGVVRCGIHMGIEVYSIFDGYKGMIEGNIQPMKHSDVSNILARGGTILRTARSLEFKTDNGQERAVANLKKFGIEGLVVIGGDGSLTGAKILGERFGIKSIGIPGSIDNDIYGTDLSLGVDTALNVITNAIDMINNTASSHGRTFIIEVMGRNCGYLAAMSALVTGADGIIIPEVKPDIDAITKRFIDRYKEGKTRNILIVAEGAGSATYFAEELAKGGDFDARITVLGHIQRGGLPTFRDRELGTIMGIKAVESLIANKSGFMTAIKGEDIFLVPYDEVFSRKNAISDKLLDSIAKVL